MIRQVLSGMGLEIALGRNLSIAERDPEVAALINRQLATKVSAALRNRFE
jgi:hypothetical protein